MSEEPRSSLSPTTWSTPKQVFWGVLVLILLGALIVVAVRSGDDSENAAETPELATAEVTQQDLVNREVVDGTLEFGESSNLVTQTPGVVTQTADDGDKVKRNGQLWKVNQRPTLLFFGAVPAYRTLGVGDNGRDVRQLERNLKALGYGGFTVNNEYTQGTADAVADWQDDVGLSDTGTLTLGQVVFKPEAIRVASVLVQAGSNVQAGAPILTVTSQERVVTIDLDTSDQSLATVDEPVVVTLPDGQDVGGTISTIGTVASAADSQTGAGQAAAATDATIPVTVTLDEPKKANQWDSAPVDVALEAERVEGVLTVPVTALLALSEGGYAVEIRDGETTRLVAVDTGLFAAGRVEVAGQGLSAGTVIVVPES